MVANIVVWNKPTPGGCPFFTWCSVDREYREYPCRNPYLPEKIGENGEFRTQNGSLGKRVGNPLADPQLNPDVYHYRELIYTCRKGYAIVSSISAYVERRCLLDGSWLSKPPVCWFPCPAAAIPHNGFISDTIQYEVSWDGRSGRRWQSRLPYGCKKRVEIWNCRNSEICPRGLIVFGPIRAHPVRTTGSVHPGGTSTGKIVALWS